MFTRALRCFPRLGPKRKHRKVSEMQEGPASAGPETGRL